MITTLKTALASSLFAVLASAAFAETEFVCADAAARMAPVSRPDSPDYRKYAPSREIDIRHLALDVTPDFRRRTVAGQAVLRFQPIARPLAELRLDAVDLTVTNVSATEKILGWQVTDERVIVTFDPPIPADREATVTLRYHAQPQQGLYFRTPEMGYRPEDEHLWTQGEEIEARHWYPCPDAPNAKFTSEITCRVPAGMVVLSNGRKVSEEQSGGLVAVRWLQDKPHANYLISLLAGHFQKVEDRYRDIPLEFWTVPSDFKEAANSFATTKDTMAFLEKEIGVPYPWAKYDQVCVRDFVAGGMENTSITTLTDGTLFTPATENIRSSQGLVAHEMAHQWFGDLVTCKDWSQIWLNEGFATFYEQLYDEHKNGRDEFLYRLYQGAKAITDQTNDTRPIVFRQYDQPGQMFDFHAYGKGGWVLRMLRSQLGPDLYRRCIRTYLERHQFGNVTTEDLNAVIEELSGRSFDQFFDQWVYHARQPELEADYAWDEPTKLAKLTIRQTQTLSDAVLLFHFPLPVRFRCNGAIVDRQIIVKEKAEDFYFPLPQAPEIVRLDPELTVLAKVNFRPPGALLAAQLTDRTDVVGRLLALEQLRSRKDHEAVAGLKAALNGDAFYGVRIEASKALRAIHSDEALDALVASTKQTDARVRRQVVADLGGFYRDSAYAALAATLQKEKNPDIVAEAINGLDAYPRTEVHDVLLRYLRSESYRQSLAQAAMRAMQAQDDPGYVVPLLETLSARERDFPSRVLTTGLFALANLDREQTDRTAVRELLARYTNHPRKTVQLAALAALGRLEDPRAVPLLQTFASAAKDSPERVAAERAIEDIRARQKSAPELGDLRKEVLDLQQQDRDLRKELEALKKKLEAVSSTPAKAQSKRGGK